MAVADKVKSIIVEQLGVDEEEVTPDASFVDDLGADSLDTVELVMAFEEEFGIEIPDEDAEKILASRKPSSTSTRTPNPRSNGGPAASGRHGHRPGVVARHRDGRKLGCPACGHERRGDHHQVRPCRVRDEDRG